MKINVVNVFHNVNEIAVVQGELTAEKINRLLKVGCYQKECKCQTHLLKINRGRMLEIDLCDYYKTR